MRFEVTGAGSFAAAGNGDSTSTELFCAGSIKAFHGQCVCIVRAGTVPGRLRLTANAEGLPPAEMELEVKK